jgi:hypothetical protein
MLYFTASSNSYPCLYWQLTSQLQVQWKLAYFLEMSSSLADRVESEYIFKVYRRIGFTEGTSDRCCLSRKRSSVFCSRVDIDFSVLPVHSDGLSSSQCGAWPLLTSLNCLQNLQQPSGRIISVEPHPPLTAEPQRSNSLRKLADPVPVYREVTRTGVSKRPSLAVICGAVLTALQ